MTKQGDPASACELLFICAALQKGLRCYPQGLELAHDAWSLAERNHLSRVTWWAAWAASSLSAHQGDKVQSVSYLEWLLDVLSAEDHWLLSNLVWLAKQQLAEPIHQADATNSIAADWLLRWGESPLKIETSIACSEGRLPNCATGVSQALPGDIHKIWRGSLWEALRKLLRGELRLGWLEKGAPGTAPARLEAPSQALKSLSTAEMKPKRLLRTPRRASSEVHMPFSARPADALLQQARRQRRNHTPVELELCAWLLGSFRVYLNEKLIENWLSQRGCSIFKFLLVQHGSPVSREVLMDVFWPDSDPKSARNNLNVALHGLRQSFRAVTQEQVIVYVDSSYGLNPVLSLWLDIDEFERGCREGSRLEASARREEAIHAYKAAVELYIDDLMVDDPYEDWVVSVREQLRLAYLHALDQLSHLYYDQQQYPLVIELCQKILARDNCREDAHRLLMFCYSRQDQHCQALRQYSLCVEALRSELDVAPSESTQQLHEKIRRREPV